jgi:hypothetical protein
MVDAQTSRNMSPKLLEVAERAKRAPDARFNSLAHLLDVKALQRAYRRMRKDAAVGVDGSRRMTTDRTSRCASRTCTHG